MIRAELLRAKQEEENKQRLAKQVGGFASLVESRVKEYSDLGLHQVSVTVPQPLLTSLKNLVVGYEKLGYNVRINREMGFLGLGFYKSPATYLTLGW